MTAYAKIMQVVDEFLGGKNGAEESEAFSTLFMDMFFELSDLLYEELPRDQYELLDDMNYTCDLYEKCPAIRGAEPFCLDEARLRNKAESLRDALRRWEA